MQKTLYYCDRCSREVAAESHLWVVKVVTPDAGGGGLKLRRFELCEVCKDGVLAQCVPVPFLAAKDESPKELQVTLGEGGL